MKSDRTAIIREARDEKRQTATAPAVALAGADQNQAIPQPTETSTQFLFVTQTTHYDERGSAIVRLCVWRVTFDGDNRQTIQQETIVRVL